MNSYLLDFTLWDIKALPWGASPREGLLCFAMQAEGGACQPEITAARSGVPA